MIATTTRRRRKKQGLHDPKYLAWIRSLPCLLCLVKKLPQGSITEAHHHGARGLGQKVSDRRAIPLCMGEHHQFGRSSVHRLGRRFAEFHGIDIEEAIRELNRIYSDR